VTPRKKNSESGNGILGGGKHKDLRGRIARDITKKNRGKITLQKKTTEELRMLSPGFGTVFFAGGQ